MFTTILTVNPGIFDGRALWLGVKAGSDPEMTPRQQILPVPYALTAKNQAGGISDQILTVVLDIQGKVTTILSGQTSLQANVTMINKTANTINKKLDAWMGPIRYEYYTAPMYTPKTLSSIYDHTTLTNSGDSDADVCYYKYLKQGSGDFYLKTSRCTSVAPGKILSCTPTIVANSTYQYKMKFTTNSPYIIPYTALLEGSGTVYIDVYHPGEFQKVEIYQ